MTRNVMLDEKGNECGGWVNVVVEPSRKHAHYYKDVSKLKAVDENIGCYQREVQLSILKSKMIDYPVTRFMNQSQMSEYLSLVKNHLEFDCGIDIDGVMRYEQT